MFKNLNPRVLGVSGRQSELIELALTYGFRGLDVDIADFYKRVEARGLDHTARYLRSAQNSAMPAMKLRVGGFELPVRWQADEIAYKEAMGRLRPMMELAHTCQMQTAYTTVMPGVQGMPFDQCFDFHTKRLTEVAECLAEFDIKLGLGFLAAPVHREELQNEFIHKAEPLVALVKAINRDNVGAIFDSWNWHFGEGTLDQLKDLGAARIIAVRLADARPEDTVESIKETDRLLPEEGGAINNTDALRVLGEMEFEGPVTVVPNGQKFAGMTREKIVQEVAAALDKPWKAAGLNRAGKLAPEEEDDGPDLFGAPSSEDEGEGDGGEGDDEKGGDAEGDGESAEDTKAVEETATAE